MTTIRYKKNVTENSSPLVVEHNDHADAMDALAKRISTEADASYALVVPVYEYTITKQDDSPFIRINRKLLNRDEYDAILDKYGECKSGGDETVRSVGYLFYKGKLITDSGGYLLLDTEREWTLYEWNKLCDGFIMEEFLYVSPY